MKSVQNCTFDQASKFRSKNVFFDIFVLLSFPLKILLLPLRFIFNVALVDSFLKKVLLSPSPKMAIFDRNFKSRAQFQSSFAFDAFFKKIFYIATTENGHFRPKFQGLCTSPIFVNPFGLYQLNLKIVTHPNKEYCLQQI